MVNVSTPAMVCVPPVTLLIFTVAESAEPVTSLKVIVWFWAVSVIAGAKDFPSPWKIVVFVAPWLVRLTKPDAFETSTTLLAAVLVMLTFSIFFSTDGVTEPLITA